MDPTILDDPERSNAQLIKAIKEGQEGMLKVASELSDGMVKRRLRENGVARRVQPYKDITENDLTPSLTNENPWKIDEMESDQLGAVSLNYNDSPDTEWFQAEKFGTYLNPISSPEFTKNIYHLMTYKSDVREVVTGNMLKDIHTQEDRQYFAQINRICGPSSGVGLSNFQQSFITAGRIGRASYADIKKNIENNQLNVGCYVLNRATPDSCFSNHLELRGCV